MARAGTVFEPLGEVGGMAEELVPLLLLAAALVAWLGKLLCPTAAPLRPPPTWRRNSRGQPSAPNVAEVFTAEDALAQSMKESLSVSRAV